MMVTGKRLIVNADGYGFGPGATRGVGDALREGRFITSVSVNPNFPEADQVRELVAEFPHISIGVHLNPMVGKPCLPRERVPTLVGGDGSFHNRQFLPRLRRGAIARAELEAELDAQIMKVRDLVGHRLTHLDSQAHSHLHYFGLFLSLARKWRVERMRTNASLICLEASRPKWARFRTYLGRPDVWAAHRFRRVQMRRARGEGMRLADNLVTVGYAKTGNKTSRENWIRVLKNLPSGTYEIYCHPGYPDETLRYWSRYCDERQVELELLRTDELTRVAKESGVDLISFHSL